MRCCSNFAAATMEVSVLGLLLALTLTTSTAEDSFTRDLGTGLVLSYSPAHGLRIASNPRPQLGEYPKSFSAELGVSLTPELLAAMQTPSTTENGGLRLDFGPSTHLEVIKVSPECSSVSWISEDPEIRDCVSYGTSQWYGGPEQGDQYWPAQKMVRENYAYVTNGQDNMGLAERFWLTSEGVYLYVAPEVPLFIDANATGDNRLCFVAKFEQPFLTVAELRLDYDICSLPTARDGHMHALQSVLNSKPTALPDERMLTHPIWSTWARYKREIDETIVLQFAQEILAQGYNNSQLEIDDDWETCYGELQFSPTKFPDPASHMRQLKALGFRVTLWIHPFMNTDCPSFNDFREKGYFVADADGNTETSWWNGQSAAIVDFSKPEVAEWFVGRVRDLQELSEVDSFKFDAGETGWLPKPRVLTGEPSLQPNLYSTKYVRALAEFVPLAEVRSGFQTQDVPIFVRMVDKDSRWGINNGLQSVVTSALLMNIVGYPYVLPDMIGGNGYGETPSAELFIRWLQASTFMPALQFSYVPWDFNDVQVDEICKKFVEMHAEYAPEILIAANESVYTGWPINTPVWYVYENGDLLDETAFAIGDQFMLGKELMVAPVLEEGKSSRDVYLPPGIWQDLTTGLTLDGNVWLRDYPAYIDVLPHFRLIGRASGSRLMLTSSVLLVLTLWALLRLR